jgi:hypothetical protein
MSTKSTTIATAIVLAIVALGIGLHTNVIKLPVTRTLHAQYTLHYEDDKVLMGDSHNVFVGKVISQVGSKDLVPGILGTQFSVSVVLNIKGVLQRTIVVAEEGGYRNGILYVIHGGDVLLPNKEGEDSLLQPGSTYVFATRYSKQNNWYTLNSHPNASKVLSQDASLDGGQLRVLAVEDAKVKAFEQAYPNEILSKGDVKYKTEWNSYAARHYDASGALIDDTVVLHEQYLTAHPATSTEPSASPVSSDMPVNSQEASVSPTTAPAGDMASDMPLAS